MLLLDTNAAIWLVNGDAQLGAGSRAVINEAAEKEHVVLSVATFLEIGFLHRKGKAIMEDDPADWRRIVLGAGVSEISVSGDVAILASLLENFQPDPWDRIIVATALHHKATLVTSDREILRWKGGLKCLDARR